MFGKTPSAKYMVVRPLRDGVISEFEITEAMLDYFIRKAHEQSWVPIPRPRVVVGIPSGVTEVEKRAVYDATISAGAREAYLIEVRFAARLAPAPIQETLASMNVDFGGADGGRDLSLGGIVISRSIRCRRRNGRGHRPVHALQVQPADRRAHG